MKWYQSFPVKHRHTGEILPHQKLVGEKNDTMEENQTQSLCILTIKTQDCTPDVWDVFLRLGAVPIIPALVWAVSQPWQFRGQDKDEEPEQGYVGRWVTWHSPSKTTVLPFEQSHSALRKSFIHVFKGSLQPSPRGVP